MKKLILFITIISLFLFSCEEYENSPISTDYVSSLNDTILKEHTKGAAWTHSPEKIARHFYPAVPNETNPNYTIESKSKSSSVVTIDEGGPYDDEVLGERYILYLRLKDELWTIVNVKHQIKRRL